MKCRDNPVTLLMESQMANAAMKIAVAVLLNFGLIITDSVSAFPVRDMKTSKGHPISKMYFSIRQSMYIVEHSCNSGRKC